jgi:hypothetical protein
VVLAVLPNGMRLRNAAGREVTVDLVPNYTLRLNGKVVAPSEIQVGDRAVALGRMVAGQMESELVLVRRRERS